MRKYTYPTITLLEPAARLWRLFVGAEETPLSNSNTPQVTFARTPVNFIVKRYKVDDFDLHLIQFQLILYLISCALIYTMEIIVKQDVNTIHASCNN